MNYNSLIPELGVTDYKRSLEFYTRMLPFKVEYERPETNFAFLSLGNAQLMIEQLRATTAATDQEFQNGNWRTAELQHPFGRGISLSICVHNLNHILTALTQANYPIKMPPKEVWYRRNTLLVGERQMLVMDPDGYLLRFQESLGERVG